MFINPIPLETAEARRITFTTRWPTTATASNGRAERAVRLATNRALVETTDDPAIFLVHSESNPIGAYTVNTTAKTCTCPDHGKAAEKGYICKHRLVIAFLTNFGKEMPQPAPVKSETDILWEKSLEMRAQITPLTDERYMILQALCALALVTDDWRAKPEAREEAKTKSRDLLAKGQALSAQISKLAREEQKISNEYYFQIGARQTRE